jgi:hypothetical protein
MRTMFVLALSLTACLRSTVYRCAQDTECGAGGSCDPLGYCSFADGTCESGQRFGEASGSHAGQCTTSSSDIDAGIDMAMIDGTPIDGPPIDMAIDADLTVCPGSYAPIAGGQAGHVYRVIPNVANWNAQRAACAQDSDSAYIAIPDDAGELAALATLAVDDRFWVGVTDAATEGTWLTVLGDPQTFLPWEGGAPDDQGPGEDCVEGVGATTQFNDHRCGQTQRVAVCECVPP